MPSSKIIKRPYFVGNIIDGYVKLKTKCPFHNYIKIGGKGCSECYCNEGTTNTFVKCSFPTI
jgi:hypothetical protein